MEVMEEVMEEDMVDTGDMVVMVVMETMAVQVDMEVMGDKEGKEVMVAVMDMVDMEVEVTDKVYTYCSKT